METHHIFISYSDADRAWLDAFTAALRSRSFQVWFDESLKPGELWETALRKAFDDSDTLLAVLSDKYTESPKAAFELGAALSQRKTIIPILPESMRQPRWPVPIGARKGIVRRSPQETAEDVRKALQSNGI